MCQLRPQDKFTTVYFAQFAGDGERQAYKMRLCDNCIRDHIGPMIVERDPSDRLTCPQCGEDTDDSYEAVYGTMYGRHFEGFQIEAPYCGVCALAVRAWIAEHGATLEDRRGAVNGPTTHPSGSEVLRSMGIVPRVR